MGIDKIGSVNNYNDYAKVNAASKIKKSEAVDSVAISSQASELSETKRVLDMVNEAPDVRADKVAALKARINDPDYINENVINALADKLLDSSND